MTTFYENIFTYVYSYDIFSIGSLAYTSNS
jgi:hypothetical protein